MLYPMDKPQKLGGQSTKEGFSYSESPFKLTHKGRAKQHPTDGTSKLMHKVTKTLHTPLHRTIRMAETDTPFGCFYKLE